MKKLCLTVWYNNTVGHCDLSFTCLQWLLTPKYRLQNVMYCVGTT